ncbi:MAG: diaminopimelate decarboxylase [Pseudomonadota bacterium]
MTQPNPYAMQGLDLDNVCRQFGTPLYVYDTDVIRRQVKHFQDAFQGIDMRIMYAVKACSNLSIIKFMGSLGLGLDTVSVPEIHMGLALGFSPSDMVFTPNVVDFSEIREAVSLGTAINLENLQNLESFGRAFGGSHPACIRLNPNMVSEIDHGRTTGLDFAAINKEHYADVTQEQVAAWHNQSKFGISLTQFDQVLSLVRQYNIRINGIHLHSSHVILNKEVFVKGARVLFELARQFPDVEYVDFGGGIMVKHHPDDTVLDPTEVAPLLKKEYQAFKDDTGREIQVWFEPGRYLVSEAGVLLTRAVVLKNNGSIDFVGTDTGFNHLLRPMMYDAFHDIVNLSNPGGQLKTYNVVGNLCEIDNLGTQRSLNEVSLGDILMIRNAGAYGFSMSSHYNSRPKPAEVLIMDSKAHLIRKRDGYEDLVRNQIVLDF